MKQCLHNYAALQVEIMWITVNMVFTYLRLLQAAPEGNLCNTSLSGTEKLCSKLYTPPPLRAPTHSAESADYQQLLCPTSLQSNNVSLFICAEPTKWIHEMKKKYIN